MPCAVSLIESYSAKFGHYFLILFLEYEVVSSCPSDLGMRAFSKRNPILSLSADLDKNLCLIMWNKILQPCVNL